MLLISGQKRKGEWQLDELLKKLFKFRNETATSADLYFYGDIVTDWWGAWQNEDQYPDAVKNFLTDHRGKDLNIYINSGGGSVFAGIAIYNMLKRHKGKKTVYVDALAGSIASVIAFAGDRVVIPSNSFLMIHKPWAECVGNSEDMRKMAEDLESVETGILNIYEEHLKEGISIDAIKGMMAEETWLNGELAAEYFNIEIGEEKAIAAAVTEETKKFCKSIPEEILAHQRAQEKIQEEKDQEKRNSITKIAIAAIAV